MNRADRRDLYRLLGGLLQRSPSEALLSALASTATLRRLAGGVAREGAVRDALRWMDADLARGTPSFVQIRQDYSALFARPGRPLAPPWESAYRAADAATDVRRAYAARGIVFEGMGERAPDHVGYELEFVSVLLAQGTHSRTARRARNEFLSEHVLRWLPAWAADVCEHSTGVFMHGVGDVVAGLCAAERHRLTSPRRWAREPFRIISAA